MALDFDGTASYVEATSAIVTTTPLTLAAWFYLDVNNVNQTIVGITASGATNARFTIQVQNTGVLRAGCQAGSSTTGADSSANTSTGTWQHGCAVFTSSTSRTIYLDGGNSGSDTTSSTPSSAALNRTTVGTQWRNQARENFANARVAEVAVWNAALNATEAAALAKGIRPSLVRPQSLVFYAPLIRDVIDVRGGVSLTASSTTVIEHPRRIG